MKGILGRKVGMTGVFTTDGKLIPVTVIECEPNVITQIKTVEKDGYNAIQLGAFNKKEKASNRPEVGHAKKAKTEPKRFLKEIRGIDASNYEEGAVLDVNTFEIGELVDVTGTSKGKGFAGVIKRHNQSRGPMSHGSTYHRRVGSLGPMRPMRVLKGKKLPGHMGNETVTIQNLEIISIDAENNCLLISGNVPGPKGGYVLIRTAIKGGKNTPSELISYEVIETVDAKESNVEEINETITSEESVVEASAKEVVEENTIEETEEREESINEEVKTSSEDTKEAE